ncbi:MAG: DUF998 domain-containing protein [Candidatus Hodarchaeales archaeon]|jgi:hypothetical protein
MKIDIKMSSMLKLVITGFGLTVVLLLIAMALYPGYNQFEQTISKLGNLWPSSFFFSLALLIEAVTFSYILSKLKTDILNLFKEQIRKFVIIYILDNIMILCLIGVVVFPSKGATSEIHDVIAVTLFLIMAITSTWVSSIADSTLKNWKKPISYLGYVCSLLVFLLGFLLLFGEFGPIIQKITVILFNIWVVLLVYEFQEYSISKT